MSGLLTVDALRVDLGRHDKVRVLDSAVFAIGAGELVGLIGETGSLSHYTRRDGVLLTSAVAELDLSAVSVKLIDTIGAGDAFMSGLLTRYSPAAWTASFSREAWGVAEVEQVSTVALAKAALTVRRAGASPPTIEELESLLPTLGSGRSGQ